jgi:dTDP-4-dehydrorhamnose 3,5-epimerase
MNFEFRKTFIDSLVVIEGRRFKDERGFFCESYKFSDFAANGITDEFKQDNHSFSTKGVVRGLHFQIAPQAQSKLVRCVRGEIYDVAVDLRKTSKTFGQFFGIKLSDQNHTMLYIPEGFAHGFSTLSDEAEVLYKTSNEYDPKSELGIKWNDTDLAINWQVKNPIISKKDEVLPSFQEIKSRF